MKQLRVIFLLYPVVVEGKEEERDNVPAHELEEYFKRSVTIPFLDHLVNELKQRFRSDQQCVVQGFILIPAVMKENPNCKKQVMGLGIIL